MFSQSLTLPNPPSIVEYKSLKFLIMDAPSTSNLDIYIQEMKKHNVTDLVRVCEPTYPKERVEANNIVVHDWPFNDGDPPPALIVKQWKELVKNVFKNEDSESKKPCIAIHCVAGLGRAPVLVAIALIEEGMNALDSVSYIRERRRGAINNKQLKYIEAYKKKSKKKGCIIL
ncbi:dual specificity protein phosphatase CDC14B [Neocallimastix lanati (nom. inval.)]|uniref:protein-tyrosine-phosphatase n=1 Tax=Neocallimastix californiae TaxID=1754190 RepID=A0A1Y2ASF8_9FUNG|nr:dual specificity protein phosphatase CDC14B [Neocallimastix sp. JGI-2020a]ORY25499.1 dual specificity protein phosphatase CDC14B [Neocallimastix californiae]|eukprot:ORY25499.1 dual specificity protein phosphatase CDC14B [Neocallimastix californiae]